MSIAITVTPHRTSGVAPLFVSFDATATTSTQTSNPFHELYSEWDFDDAGKGNWGAGSRTDCDKNEFRGLVAGHLYATHSAGGFDPILTVFDGVDIAQEVVDTITTSDPDTVYAGTATVCVSTSGNFTGAPSGHDPITSSDLDAVISTHYGQTKRILFCGGETFTSSTTMNLAAAGPWTIGAYGTGRPIFNIASGAFTLGTVLSTLGDGRIMGIEMTAGGSTTVTALTMVGTVNNLTIYNNDLHDMRAGLLCDGISHVMNAQPSGLALVENTIDDIDGSGGCGVFGSFTDGAALGNTISDMTGDGEHCFRLMLCQRSIISFNTISNPNGFGSGPGPKHCIALRAPVFTRTYGRLHFDNQTVDFLTGTLTGGTSGATVGITTSGQTDNGATGYLHIADVLTGTFLDNETITSSGGGSAQVNGAMVIRKAANVYTEYVIVSYNKGVAGPTLTPFESCTSDGNDERARHIIWEKNWLCQGTGTNMAVGIWVNNSSSSVRNNIVDFTNSERTDAAVIGILCAQTGLQDECVNLVVYHNTVYYPGTLASRLLGISIEAGVTGPLIVRNNLGYAPNEPTSELCVDNPGTNTEGENTTDANMDASPNFASATPVNPVDFKITAGSYAIGAGNDTVKVFDDFFDNIRDWDAPDTDIGFHAFTVGALPSASPTPKGSLGGLG